MTMAMPEVTQTESVTPTGGLKFGQSILLATVVVSLAMAFNIAFNHQIGVVADLSLLAVSAFIAIKISKTDVLASHCAPTISWFIALITVGQFSTTSGGSWKAQQVFLLVYGLGSHFVWIFAATVLTVVVRFFRDKKTS
mgnify:CR=1 FL=1